MVYRNIIEVNSKKNDLLLASFKVHLRKRKREG